MPRWQELEVTEEMELKSPMLFIGGGGLVGSVVTPAFPGAEIVGHRTEFNILTANDDEVKRFLERFKGGVLVNFAAYTDVGKAQQQKDLGKASEAYLLNVEGPIKLARACKELGILDVHMSTDFVFPGKLAGDNNLYTENDFPDPRFFELLNYYGYTKAVAELELLDILDIKSELVFVRIAYPSTVGKGWIYNLRTGVEKGYGMFKDQRVTPTLPEEIRIPLAKIARGRMAGVHHVVSSDTTSPYKQALWLQRLGFIGNEMQIREGSMEEYLSHQGRTPSPIRGGLDTRITRARTGAKFLSCEDQAQYLVRRILRS